MGLIENKVSVASGGVLTDTHAASLTGADTHAASLTGADTHAASLTNNNNGNGFIQSSGTPSAAIGIIATADTNEQTLAGQNAVAIGTPTQTTNTVYRGGQGKVENSGATATTFTLRLKDNVPTTLTSVTTASIGQNTAVSYSLNNFVSNEATTARTVTVTVQRTTAAEAYIIISTCWGCVISGSLTGADTHAASLTGADTHAASLTGAASCSACTCS